MTFSYQTYFEAALVLPLSVLALLLAVFCCISYKYWFSSKRHAIGETLGYILCLCAFVWCLIPQCRYLLNGGFYLLREKAGDALESTGTIECITGPSKHFPGFKISHNYGADIVIDGELFFMISSGDYKEGDSVTVRYLPDSHFILEIQNAGIPFYQ